MSDSRPENAPSQSTASAVISFFSLPNEIRNDIYKRVLAVPHPLYLFQDTGCPVEAFAPERPSQWLALLYTNRQISDEARAILYGINQFTLQEVETIQRPGSLLKSFLNCIGPVNAGWLSHLCINFPATERIEGQPGEIKLREDSLQSLQLLQKECTKLKTLETLIYSQNSSDLVKEDLNNTGFVRDVLLEINAQFRGIASLNKVIVRVYNGSPSPSVKEFLQELGWAVLIRDR